MQPACMREVLINTNALFEQHQLKAVTPSEFACWLGCVFAICIYGGRVGPRRDHWAQCEDGDDFPGLQLGRFMGARRFDDLLNNMVWGYSEQHPAYDATDLWWPVRQLVEAQLWAMEEEPPGMSDDGPVNLGRRRRSARALSDHEASDSNSSSDEGCKHDMQPLAASGLGGKTLTCCFCGAHSCARWYCTTCSQDCDGEITSVRQMRAFCGIGNARGCQGLSLHIQTGGRSDRRAEQRRGESVIRNRSKRAKSSRK
jgi:hypothetical protein